MHVLMMLMSCVVRKVEILAQREEQCPWGIVLGLDIPLLFLLFVVFEVIVPDAFVALRMIFNLYVVDFESSPSGHHMRGQYWLKIPLQIWGQVSTLR